ncbi:TetR/AcrR family transcriptional regulator [Streptomyces sp. NPDC001941]|uniref:TetR/AcrR family transcriptional regulator n=1 Tax=Streptomyces sp. NPDC001941 TaxID=3154659 RepID=UPI003325E0EC
MASAGRTSVWLQGKAPRGRRAEQPSGLDLARITEVTVRLLDAEGLARFSMRKLAAELNVTAMSVYWYVDTKDDLLELALDRVHGQMVLPDPDSGADWRVRLRELATAYRSLIVSHPWVSPLTGTFLNIGPQALEFARATQALLADTGLPLPVRSGALASLMQFVYGFGTIEGHFRQRCAAAGKTQDEYVEYAMGAVREEPGYDERFGWAESALEARGGGTVAEMRDRDFEVALGLQIAGIEALVARGGTA